MPVYPGDPTPRLNQSRSVARGDPYTISLLACGTHTGTHVDAPAHFIPGGLTIDQVPAEVLVGPAHVVEVQSEGHIEATHLAALLPAPPERLLLKTRNSALWALDSFRDDFVALTPSAAQWLVDHGVRLVGLDYLSIEPYGSHGFPVHHILLGAGVVAVEGLDLRAVPPGAYTLLCLPLKLQGADAAPARVLLVAP